MTTHRLPPPAAHWNCTSCHQKIRWVITPAGIRMPIDFHSSPEGNLAVEGSEDWRLPAVARVLRKDEVFTGPRFKSHFATCAYASKHRKR